MNAPPVIAMTADSSRNLLRVTYAGDIAATDVEAAAARLGGMLAQIQPGFTVLADLSQVASMDLASVPHLAGIMERFRAHGIGLVVRLLPAPDRDIGINLISIIHYRGEVKTVTVDTLEEAERALG
jgi:anti-anti-sigma regulatory factor